MEVTKPHLKKYGHKWACQSEGIVGVDDTPGKAYQRWRGYNLAAEAVGHALGNEMHDPLDQIGRAWAAERRRTGQK